MQRVEGKVVPLRGVTKIDLGCGKNLQEGFTGIDSADVAVLFEGEEPPVDYKGYIRHDLFSTPWPLPDNCIEQAFSSHFVEHIPHYHPNWEPHQDGWWVFFAELYRVCQPDAEIVIVHPFSRHDRAFWDPTHTRYIHFQTWFYLQKDWRQEQGINHYVPDIDFKVESIDGLGEPAALANRSQQSKDFAHQHYFNPTEDLVVRLRVQK